MKNNRKLNEEKYRTYFINLLHFTNAYPICAFDNFPVHVSAIVLVMKFIANVLKFS